MSLERASSNDRSFRGTIGPSLIVLLVGLAVLIGGPSLIRTLASARETATIELATDELATSNPLLAFNSATRALAQKVGPSVVHVSTRATLRGADGARAPRGGFYTSSGSGWVFDDTGHIITNAHVVASADEIEVQLSSGEIRSAQFIGADAGSDIAVVKVSPERLHPAERSRERPQQGELVFAFGSPFDFRFSMSSGIVSGLGRTAGLAELDYEDFIQVDAAVNPGNSGGPLADVTGRVIGMNTAIATGRGNRTGEGQFAGIGLAIPMEMIEQVVEQLVEHGELRKGFLGISMRELDAVALPIDDNSPQADAYKKFVGRGVLIQSVVAEGPAARAGIAAGDILLMVDGEEVASIDNVKAKIGLRSPGTTVVLSIVRWDSARATPETMTREVTLGTMDPEVMFDRVAAAVHAAGLLDLETLTPEAARRLGTTWVPGVHVGAIAPRATVEGPLRAGAVIQSVAGQAVSSMDDLYSRIQQQVLSARGVRGGVLPVRLGIRSAEGDNDEAILYLR